MDWSLNKPGHYSNIIWKHLSIGIFCIVDVLKKTWCIFPQYCLLHSTLYTFSYSGLCIVPQLCVLWLLLSFCVPAFLSFWVPHFLKFCPFDGMLSIPSSIPSFKVIHQENIKCHLPLFTVCMLEFAPFPTKYQPFGPPINRNASCCKQMHHYTSWKGYELPFLALEKEMRIHTWTLALVHDQQPPVFSLSSSTWPTPSLHSLPVEDL